MNYGYMGQYEKMWWDDELDNVERHEAVVQLVDQIRLEQKYIETDNLEHLRLYMKRAYSMDEDGGIKASGADPRIGINATKSAIDTVSAQITQQDPLPQFVTQGGRWGQRLKARKLQKFVEGVFDECKFYHEYRRAFKDGAIFGTGFVKFYTEKGRVKCERVFPGEIIVDEQAAMNGKPLSMFQVKYVPLETLLAAYPDKKDEILVSKVRIKTRNNGVSVSMVRIIEAWHLPDMKGKNGRHCIVLDGATLYDGNWKHDFFPFVVFRWNELPVGYYGNGAAEDLHGLQEEIDYLMQRIQTSMHVNANAWLLKHKSDTTPNSHFTNRIGTIIEWSGQHPPELRINPALHQQVFDHAKWLHELVFDDTGVSQMSATSRKPKGIESGVALQTLLDVESQRHAIVQKNYEAGVVLAAKICISMVSSRGTRSDYSVKYDGGRFSETIDWSEVNIPEDEYVLKVWPANMLPKTPAGRMEWVERMMQAGLVDSQTGMMLLDFPDVEAHQSLALASTRYSLWVVDKIIYEQEYIEPKAWHDLQRCTSMLQVAMSNAEMEGAPPEVSELVTQYLLAAQDLMQPPQPTPDPMAGDMMQDPAMGGMPPMPPEGMPPGGMPPEGGMPPMPPGGATPPVM